MESLIFSNKIHELKQVGDIFPEDFLIELTYFIKDTLKEIMELQNSIKINDLYYLPTKKNYNFSNFSLLTVLLRII